MIRPSMSVDKVHLYREFVDMRKAVNTLSVIVECEMELSPFDKALFVFCNRSRKIIKILNWENNGFVLWTKKLTKDRFHWPGPEDINNSIDGKTLNWLLDGLNYKKLKPHKKLSYDTVL